MQEKRLCKLQAMSKEDLVYEVIRLDKRVELLRHDSAKQDKRHAVAILKKNNEVIKLATENKKFLQTYAADMFAVTKMSLGVARNRGDKFIMGSTYKQKISKSTFNKSPVAIKQSLQDCFDTIQQIADAPVKEKLEQLHEQVAQLMAQSDPKMAEKTRENLDMLVKQAAKPEPDRKWYDLSADGLIEAAQTVKELTAPVTKVVQEIAKLLFE
jgi:hypothetical protein